MRDQKETAKNPQPLTSVRLDSRNSTIGSNVHICIYKYLVIQTLCTLHFIAVSFRKEGGEGACLQVLYTAV